MLQTETRCFNIANILKRCAQYIGHDTIEAHHVKCIFYMSKQEFPVTRAQLQCSIITKYHEEEGWMFWRKFSVKSTMRINEKIFWVPELQLKYVIFIFLVKFREYCTLGLRFSFVANDVKLFLTILVSGSTVDRLAFPMHSVLLSYKKSVLLTY